MERINIHDRRKGREIAVFTLFAWEMEQGITSLWSVFESIEYFFSHERELFKRYRGDCVVFARRILERVHADIGEIDRHIAATTRNWDMKRVAMLDRNILRVGVAEILYFDDIPNKVAINEAIEMAKIYSTEKSGIFVNGILDPIAFKIKGEPHNGSAD